MLHHRPLFAADKEVPAELSLPRFLTIREDRVKEVFRSTLIYGAPGVAGSGREVMSKTGGLCQAGTTLGNGYSARYLTSTARWACELSQCQRRVHRAL